MCAKQVQKVGNFSQEHVKQLRADLKALYDKVKNQNADSNKDGMIAVCSCNVHFSPAACHARSACMQHEVTYQMPGHKPKAFSCYRRPNGSAMTISRWRSLSTSTTW